MLNFPLPPPDIASRATSSAGQTIMEIAVAAGVLAVVAMAARLSITRNSPVPAAIASGALVSAFVEPLPDVTADLWYYAPGQHTIYTAFSNPFPLWTWFTYLIFYGGGGLAFWMLIEKGLDRRRVYLACIPLAVFLGCAELFMINVMKVYTYYGDAAFVVDHYPVWIPLLNTAIIALVGVGTARIIRSLSGKDAILVAVLLPGAAMVLGLLLAPAVLWTTIHSHSPSSFIVHLATIVTMAVAVGLIRIATLFMPTDGFALGAPSTSAAAEDVPPARLRTS